MTSKPSDGPPTTAARRLPGAFEGETVSRRRFMTGTAHAAGAVAAAAFTLPALGFAIAPIFKRPSATWQDAGAVSRFTDSNYVPVVLTTGVGPGAGESDNALAYIRLHNQSVDGPPKDRYDRVIALSSRCAHVGCPVRYVSEAQSFICPCHGGVYNFLGKRVGGPPPRPLDRFYTLIRDRRVLVGPRYSVNGELRRFAPRPPGVPLDGIGQFLYPAQFDTAPAPPGAAP